MNKTKNTVPASGSISSLGAPAIRAQSP